VSSAIPWLAISVLVLLLVFLVVFKYRRTELREPDYRLYFRIGVIWLAFGLGYPFVTGRPFELSWLTTMGLVFTIAGLANKSKWKEKA